LRQAGAGDAGFKSADLCGHAATVFEPQRAGNRIGVFDLIVLAGNRLIGNPVFGFKPRIDFTREGARRRASGHREAAKPIANRASSASRAQSGTMRNTPNQDRLRNSAATPRAGAARVMKRPSAMLNRMRMRPKATDRRVGYVTDGFVARMSAVGIACHGHLSSAAGRKITVFAAKARPLTKK
jgi:hypothetical protein